MPILLRAAAAAPALLLGLVTAAAAQTAASPATFRVVHGIPGRDVAATLDPQLPVDVLVDGKICLIEGLTFGTVSGPFTVPAGTYAVAVSLANTVSPCSNAAVISASVTLKTGEEAAIVAALSPSGAPTAYALALDFGAIPTGDGRVMVVHAADAPAVDVTVNGKVAISNLAPGHEVSAQLPAKRYAIAVEPAGSKVPVIGPFELKVAKRTVDLVFAVGSAASGSITVITKAIPEVF